MLRCAVFGATEYANRCPSRAKLLSRLNIARSNRLIANGFAILSNAPKPRVQADRSALLVHRSRTIVGRCVDQGPRNLGYHQADENDHRCPRWVNRVTLTLRQSLPVFLSKRTISEMADMSQRCQFPTGSPEFYNRYRNELRSFVVRPQPFRTALNLWSDQYDEQPLLPVLVVLPTIFRPLGRVRALPSSIFCDSVSPHT
jgi:hypothetical protein